MIERWLTAIRDHPDRPPLAHRHVLTMLALRLDWKSGTGFASTAQLAADTGASGPTVRRATKWARKSGLLLQTRRGHRLGNGTVAASEWRLIRPVDKPSQPLTGEPLTQPQPLNGQISTAQQADLNRSVETHHQSLSSSKSSSSRSRHADASNRSEACKRRGHADCAYNWCRCQCHNPPADSDAQALSAIITGLNAR